MTTATPNDFARILPPRDRLLACAALLEAQANGTARISRTRHGMSVRTPAGTLSLHNWTFLWFVRQALREAVRA
jgi:hypothetical protein